MSRKGSLRRDHVDLPSNPPSFMHGDQLNGISFTGILKGTSQLANQACLSSHGSPFLHELVGVKVMMEKRLNTTPSKIGTLQIRHQRVRGSMRMSPQPPKAVEPRSQHHSHPSAPRNGHQPLHKGAHQRYSPLIGLLQQIHHLLPHPNVLQLPSKGKESTKGPVSIPTFSFCRLSKQHFVALSRMSSLEKRWNTPSPMQPKKAHLGEPNKLYTPQRACWLG